MQNRFEFLDDQFPKLAGYARKAQESFDADKNICLLNLGRIAENITKFLCRRLSIPDNNPEDLLKLGIIDENVYRKINALLEAKTDAVNSEYNSEMACSRLMLTAEELCRWFVFEAGESKFNFLADLFPENSPVPPLASLASFGREVEENLYSNTRYALICLGDIGEAVVNFLLNVKGIEINFHDNDQSDRINILHRKGIITKEINDTLHNIRKTRNEAVHSRFSSQEEARKLLEQTLPICEWLFKFVMTPGDFIRGKITAINQDSIDVITGRFRGIVNKEEIPAEKEYSEGERKIFKIIDAEDEKINLSLSQVYTDPWINAARRYEKYKIGQILNVRITRVEKDIGAAVEICGTYERTEARIPEAEYGNAKIRLWNEIKACVKWFDPVNYPYMILSAENVQQERNFIRFCATASPEELQEILPEVSDINQKNKNGINSLMMAALHNPNPEIIHILVNSGAKVNSVNYAGNTPLILAAMLNNPEIVRALIEHEADIAALNGKDKTAYDYALNNAELEGSDVIDMLKVKQAKTANNFTSLIAACENNNLPALHALIEANVEAEAINDEGRNALMIAAANNSADFVRALIPVTPDINTHDNDGNTALIIACESNTPEVVSVLLDSGANIAITNHNGLKALDLAKLNPSLNSTEITARLTPPLADDEFLQICASGTPEEIIDALNSGANYDAKDSNNNTALMLAAEKNNSEVVKILLNKAIDIDARNNDGNTALILASMFNDAETLSSILEHNLQINIANNKGYTALMASAQYNNSEIINVLLKAGAKIDCIDALGNSALMIACSYNTGEAVKVLLDAGSDVDITNDSGCNALMIAARTKQAEIVRDLLAKTSDINAQNKKGDTALMIACAYNTDDAVKLLLDAGADAEIRNELGSNALIIASKSKHADTIQELLRRTSDVNAQNNNGDTALIIASEFNNSEVVSSILEAKAEINTQNNEGMTALMSAVYNSAEAGKVISALLNAKPDLNLRNTQDNNAIDIAKLNPELRGSKALNLMLQSNFLKFCKTGSIEEISEYVNFVADVNIKSAKNSVTALMLAVQYNNSEVVEVLLGAGAEIDTQDARGYTALILAAAKRDEGIVTLLLDSGADANITDAKGYKALNYALGNEKLKETEALKRLRELTHN